MFSCVLFRLKMIRVIVAWITSVTWPKFAPTQKSISDLIQRSLQSRRALLLPKNKPLKNKPRLITFLFSYPFFFFELLISLICCIISINPFNKIIIRPKKGNKSTCLFLSGRKKKMFQVQMVNNLFFIFYNRNKLLWNKSAS